MLHIADANYMFGAVGSGKPSPLDNSRRSYPAWKNDEKTKEATYKKPVIDSYDW